MSEFENEDAPDVEPTPEPEPAPEPEVEPEVEPVVSGPRFRGYAVSADGELNVDGDSEADVQAIVDAWCDDNDGTGEVTQLPAEAV